ncbi:MAG: MFS transporter [Candidatus Obscuribacterales bacterium]|nr:MFS transporter [Steroidobacteraceae bacterium]
MKRSDAPALCALMVGNFVIGAGVLAPAGLINELSDAFKVGIATVGTLIAYGAAVLCVEAPLFAFLTNKIDRRFLLTASLSLYAAGHFASAFAPNFAALLAARLVMVAGAAIFTPQAASAIGLFVAPERRSSAIAFIFLGWSLASAIAIPVLSIIGARMGWSAAYLAMAGACAIAAIGVFVTLPRGLTAPPLSLAAWKKVLSSGKILLILLVTALSLAGQNIEYAFIAAELKARLNAGPELIAMLLGVYGIAGVVGAVISASAIDKLGAGVTASIWLAAVLLGLALWAGGSMSLALSALALFVWGSGVGPANSAQQARLIAADPDAASASVALNTSVIYLGQAVGTSLGGHMLTNGYTSAIGAASVGLVLLALLGSLAAYRWLRA